VFAPRAAPPGGPEPTAPVRGEGTGFDGTGFDGTLWSEYVHARGADVVASFGGGDLAGWPALTRNRVGGGSAWYVATHPDPAGLDELTGTLLDAAGVPGLLDRGADGVEAVVRGDALFLVNHAAGPRQVVHRGEELDLAPREVRIVRDPR
jgi:beta-galactosidase